MSVPFEPMPWGQPRSRESLDLRGADDFDPDDDVAPTRRAKLDDDYDIDDEFDFGDDEEDVDDYGDDEED